MYENKKIGRWTAFGLGGLQIFIGVGGLTGGLGLVSEPSGSNLGFHTDLLSKSPFSDYLIPGFVLLLINGIGNLTAGLLSFLRHRHAGLCGIIFGAFLRIWIVTQVWWIGLTIWS